MMHLKLINQDIEFLQKLINKVREVIRYSPNLYQTKKIYNSRKEFLKECCKRKYHNIKLKKEWNL
jgi:fructose/tagatose bisphosphate aldolase